MRMTLEEIKALPKETLTPKEVAAVMGSTPYLINLQAKDDPSKLGFSVYFSGNRVKIPKQSFVNFMEGRTGTSE